MRLQSALVFFRDTSRVSLFATPALRLSTIGIKTLFTLALAVWLGAADLGRYGLITATISLAVYAYGLDFYTFTVRELSTDEAHKIRQRLRDLSALFAACYLVGAVILAFTLPRFGFGAGLTILTVLLAITQHAGLELYRILVRTERTTEATTCLLLRDAAWMPVCLLAGLFLRHLSLSVVLVCWLVGSVAGVLYAVRVILRTFRAGEVGPIDKAWLARGLRTGLRMIPGTLSLRALFTVDRMILAALAPPQVLGAYVFFTSLCMSAQGLFETAVLPFFWPRLLDAARRGDLPARQAAEGRLAHACLLGGLGGALATIVVATGLASYMPNPVYAANLYLLYFVATAYSLLTLANIPHYRLYASHRDLRIVAGNMAAFASFVAAAGLIALADRAIAVPMALVVGTTTLLAFKWMMTRAAP